MGSRDFVYNLILKQDRQSFDSGARSLDKVSNNISRMIGVARNAAAALGAMHMIMGEGKALQTANAIGVTSKRLDEFKVAAKIAGVSADGLIQSMASLDQAMTDYAFGKNNPGLEKALGILSTRSGMSMNIENLRSMDAADRIEYVLKAAQKLTNKKEAASLVSDILGTAGKDFYWALETGGKSIESALAQARGMIFADEGSKQKAFGFSSELRETMAIMQQIGMFTFSELGGNLTPFLKSLNDFFKNNGGTLKESIKGFSDSLSIIAGALKPFAENALKTAVEVLLNLTNAIAALVTGDTDKAAESAKKIFGAIRDGAYYALTGGENPQLKDKRALIKQRLKKDNPGANALFFASDKKNLSDLPSDLQSEINEYIRQGGNLADFADYLKVPMYINAGKGGAVGRSMQDGIMRPDGTITRVAPDDWVFAARSVGDLARMFMPQSLQPAYAGGGSVVINQTLTLNGAADFPQEARRAAYDGTAAALRNLNAFRERRLLMPGTR